MNCITAERYALMMARMFTVRDSGEVGDELVCQGQSRVTRVLR